LIVERKRIDRSNAKAIGLMTALWMSGQNPDDVLDDEGDSRGLAGIDFPACDPVLNS
jgi:hypothetical protein